MTFKTMFESSPGVGGPSVYVLLLLVNELKSCFGKWLNRIELG